MELPYFTAEEFQRCVPACSIEDMDEGFLLALCFARGLAGTPFKLNSAYRDVDYEKLHGRPGTSSHCLGKAVDIRCIDSASRMRIVDGLVRAGFRRIGIGPTFIHCDMDGSKPSALWLYD